MRVIAAPGHRVPTEDDPYTYIEETKSVDVADTSYYRRRLAAKELLVPEDSQAEKKPRGGAKQLAQETTE